MVIKLNELYLAAASFSVLVDLVIRVVTPLAYCTVQADGSYLCRYDQLYFFDVTFVVAAFLWIWVIRRMRRYALELATDYAGDYFKA